MIRSYEHATRPGPRRKEENHSPRRRSLLLREGGQSTLRQAADLDYRITMLSDACADPDPEVHRVLMDKIFPRQALVTSTDAWIQTL